MRTHRAKETLAVLAALMVAGCSDASGTIQGGDSIFDGGQATVSEASASDDAGSLLPSNCQAGGTNAGSRWQDLYACYFGTMGEANCGQSNCHPVGGQNFWECGADKDTCFAGITSSSVSPALVPPGGMSDATQTNLYMALRKVTPSGQNNMPLAPATVMFTTADLMRISAWIQGGAPNN